MPTLLSPQLLFQHFESLADAPEAVSKLRSLVLQLAVAGRLVTHENGDSGWQEDITNEKRRGIESLRLNKHPNTSPLAQDDLPYGLPKQWLGIRLGDLTYSCPTAYGENPSPDLHTAGVITVGNVDNAGGFKGRFTERGFAPEEVEDLLAHKGDIVIVKSSGSAENVHSGKAALCREEHHRKIVGSNFVMRLRPFGKSVLPEFLWLVLISRTSRAWVERTVQTMTYPNLKWSEYALLPIGLPPPAEQRRIVAKVEELLALCDELEARQVVAREHRTRLVHSALDHLTAAKDEQGFREQCSFILHDSSLILDSVPALRQAILSLAVQGRFSPDSGSWPRVPLGKLLAEPSLNGVSKAPSQAPPGVQILRISAGTSRTDAFVNEDDFKFVELSTAEIEKFRLRKDDLLACRFNGNLHFVGRMSLYRAESGRLQVNPDKLIRFRVDRTNCFPRFVCLAMNSPAVRTEVETLCATTAGNIGISATELKEVPIPLPPLSEQHRIVARLDELMRWCNELEARLTTAQTAATRLLDATVNEVLVSNGHE